MRNRNNNNSNNARYLVDTPGFDDVSQRERSAVEIGKAFQSGEGHYKLVFVIVEDSGRVRPSDSATMRLVLDALPDKNAPYGIVVNKVSRPVKKRLEEDQVAQEKFMACANIGRNNKTPFVQLYPYDDALNDQDNALHLVRPELLDFLDKLPSFPLLPDEVDAVKTNDFSMLADQAQLEMKKLIEDKKRIEEEKRKIEEKYKLYPVYMGGAVALGIAGMAAAAAAGATATAAAGYCTAATTCASLGGLVYDGSKAAVATESQWYAELTKYFFQAAAKESGKQATNAILEGTGWMESAVEFVVSLFA